MNNTNVVFTYMKSPTGTILLARTEAGLTHINFQEGKRPLRPHPNWRPDDTPMLEAIDQLRAYFDGKQFKFELPLAADGTPFQQRVWKALCGIPCGETVTYGEIARTIGFPSGARAVGGATGRNPLPIVVPCHRVVGADGKLTGFGGGIRVKKFLLDHEAQMIAKTGAQLSIVEGW